MLVDHNDAVAGGIHLGFKQGRAPVQFGFSVLALGFPLQDFEGEADVGGKFIEQADFAGVEESGFGGVKVERAEQPAADMQRQ